MTFSIVARDAATGQVGVAALTCNLGVGSNGPGAGVISVRGGVGAVASQGFTNPTYGPKLLAALREGVPVDAAMRSLVEADAGSALRQVLAVDADGSTAAHTGATCVRYAGQVQVDGAVFAGNMLRDPGLAEAMAAAWTDAADLPFARRLLAGLAAGSEAGGDLRGRQSAALRIAEREPAYDEAYAVDVRVDDSTDPLGELTRLTMLAEGYAEAMKAGVLADAGDIAGARAAWARTRELLPESPDAAFWTGVFLAGAGDGQAAAEALDFAYVRRPAFRELLPRLAEVGLLAPEIARSLGPADLP